MARYYGDLTSREDVEAQLMKADPGNSVPAPVTDEYADFVTYVDSAIHAVSIKIAKECARRFVPYLATEQFFFGFGREMLDDNVYDALYRRLSLPVDLLVTNSVTWDGTLLSATDFDEASDEGFPYQYILFNPDSSLNWGDWGDSVDVVGIWGYHRNLDSAWSEVSASVTIDSSSSGLSVSSAAAYKTWQTIRCESEYMQITARDETGNVLTVRRGALGTTAAEHSSKAVDVFNIEKDIQLAATRYAAWAYVHRNDRGDRIDVLPDGSVSLNEVPAFVRDAINQNRRAISGAV